MKKVLTVFSGLLLSLSAFAEGDLALHDFKGSFQVRDCYLGANRAYISDLRSRVGLSGLEIDIYSPNSADIVEMPYGEFLNVPTARSTQLHEKIDFSGVIHGHEFSSTACRSNDVLKKTVCVTTILTASEDGRILTLDRKMGANTLGTCTFKRK